MRTKTTGYAVVLGTGIVALGTIRCYAQAGLRVVHLTTKKDDIAACSRYIAHKYVVPSPDTDPAGLLRLLTEELPVWPDAVLDPVNDPGVVFVSQHCDALSARYHVTVPPWDIVHGIIDKRLLYQRAYQLGIPAPRISNHESTEDLAWIARQLVYPCIIKPTQTPDFFAIYNKKALVADDAESLLAQYRDVEVRHLDVMVSEIIPGPEENLVAYICHLDDHQAVLAELCVQKIRQHPADFGYGVVKRTIPMIAEAREAALCLLRAHAYTGFSTTEFKWDDRDSKYKLIEINTRQVSYAHLFASATINFPEIMYRDKVEKRKEFDTDYRSGVYWINPVDDLYEYRRRRRLPGFSASKFIRPYFAKNKVFALSPLDDLRPFIKWIARLGSMILKKLHAAGAGGLFADGRRTQPADKRDHRELTTKSQAAPRHSSAHAPRIEKNRPAS